MLLTKTITKFSNVIGHQQPDLRVMRPRCCLTFRRVNCYC